MAYFAKLGLNNEVLDVVAVANNDCFDANGIENEEVGRTFLEKLTGWTVWKKTSYNTKAGVHYDSVTGLPSDDQSKAFRKNYAGKGMYYDVFLDAFIAKQPFRGWVINDNTAQWEAPVPKPVKTGYFYTWDNSKQEWIENVVIPQP
jgi:hypothetical protein